MSQRSRGEINLAEAARAQEVHLVAERLAAGDDVNMQDSQGNTALHWACLLGLHGLSSLLLAHDARTDIPNLNGSYAVHAAAAGKNIKAMKMLTGDKNVHTSKDVLFQQDRKGYTAFLIAAENNDVFTMEWLYFQGVSLEQRGANGESAALITSRLGHTRGLQWLISHNASIFERDNDGRNALHLACAHGRHDSIKMLMDSTSTKSLQCVDTMGDGAISLAWKHGQLHVFCWLWFVEFAEALADTLSLKSSVRAALSRSAWTTVFWTLLLLNFLTFLALLEPAGTEAMLWLALLSCVVCCWWHLSMSDPGFTGPRFAFATQEQDPELERFAELMQLPMDRQAEELTRLCGPSRSPKAAATQRASNRIDRMGDDSAPWAALWSSSKEVEDEVAPKLGSRCDPAPSGNSRSSRTFRRSDEDEWDEEGASCAGCAPSAVATVQQRWLRLSRRQQLCRALLEKYDLASLRQQAEGHQAEREKEAHLRQVEKDLNSRALKLMDEAGAARFKEISAQSGEYARLAMEGEFRTLCVICRGVRSMRSFHCKLCGCCVQRMDHHCPWVDRCIGLENQRSFYVFLILLALVFMLFLQMSINFLAEAEGLGLSSAVLLILLCDVPAMLFVLALILRQTVYMLVNVTTYEVLVCPPHMCNRFPRRGSSLWYLQGASLRSCLRNFLSYWMMDMSSDCLDFVEDSSCAEDAETEEGLQKCCQWGSSGGYYAFQRNEPENIEEMNSGTQKLNSRTVVLPRNLSL